MPDLSKLNFYSDVNTMKRDVSSGHRDMTAAAFSSASIDVSHKVGGTGVPHFIVSAENDQTGTIWRRNKLYVDMENSSTSPTFCELSAWITAPGILTLTLTNPTASSKTIPVYYVIYKDYGKIG